MRKCIKKLIICGILNLNINHVNGDVFELQLNMKSNIVPVSFLNAEQFIAFLGRNANILPGGAIDPFVGDASNATQMLGYAVFFPEGIHRSQQVYVAKKRAYDSDTNTPITDYSNITSIDDFKNSTNFDHTERQLLSRILTDYNINAETRGTLCIYTYAPPCRRKVPDNHQLCCLDYYKKFLQKNLNIELKIYFTDRKNILDGDFRGDLNFCNGLATSVRQRPLFSINLKLGEKLVQIGNIDTDPIDINNISFGRCKWGWSKRQLADINNSLSNDATLSFNNLYNCEQNPKLQFNAI